MRLVLDRAWYLQPLLIDMRTLTPSNNSKRRCIRLGMLVLIFDMITLISFASFLRLCRFIMYFSHSFEEHGANSVKLRPRARLFNHSKLPPSGWPRLTPRLRVYDLRFTYKLAHLRLVVIVACSNSLASNYHDQETDSFRTLCLQTHQPYAPWYCHR